MQSDRLQRAQDFRADALLWVTVRHFLSAGLLRELCDQAVNYASDSEVSLGDIFESIQTSGPEDFGTWVIRPKESSHPYARQLQAFVKAVVWQGDRTDFARSPTADDKLPTKLVELQDALILSRMDLNSISVESIESEAEPLKHLISVIVDAISNPEAIPEDIIQKYKSSLVERQGAINILLTKHLGDLFVDSDRWDVAEAFYHEALTLIDASSMSHWNSLIHPMRTIAQQSLAIAAGRLRTSEVAAIQLHDLVAKSSLKNNPVGVANAVTEWMSADIGRSSPVFHDDVRVARIHAPQIIEAHSLARALEAWAERRYEDAYRFFWAVLRRQIAMGSHVYACQTKGLYGRAMIEGISATLERSRQPNDYALAVRLLIEGGLPKNAEQTAWTPEIVAAYVSPELIAKSLEIVRRSPGDYQARASVAAEIFKRWTCLLPLDRKAAAVSMMLFQVELIESDRRGSFAQRDLIAAGFKALVDIAKARPDFRSLVAKRLVESIVVRLDVHSPMGSKDAFDLLEEYVDSFDESLVKTVAKALIVFVDECGAANMAWPIARPILNILESSAVRSACVHDGRLAEAVARAELRIALYNDSESTSLLYLLSRIDPKIVAQEVSEARLQEIVQGIRERARRPNSSATAANIHALLVGCEVVGPEAVHDALAGLRKVLDSASAGDPAISFGYAYQPLLLLTNPSAAISKRVLDRGSAESNEVGAIWQSLLRVWEAAPNAPEMFNGFAIPPRTAPNSVLVHNWTFASVRLGEYLGRQDELNPLLHKAMSNTDLAKPMAVASSIAHSELQGDAIDLGSVSHEQPEAFYAALGQNLVILQRLPRGERRSSIPSLVAQSLRHGPRGLDAAVFAAALEAKISIKQMAKDAAAYGRRLRADKELRLSLSPLFYALTKIDIDED